MKLHNTALAMILWLVCQQASAVVVGISSFGGSLPGDFLPRVTLPSKASSNSYSSESCHGDSNKNAHQIDVNSSKAGVAAMHNSGKVVVAGNEKASMECCDISCQCCVSGCFTMLGKYPAGLSFFSGNHLLDYHSLGLFSAHSVSLFRPPIFA